MIAPAGATRQRPNMPHYGVDASATAGMLEWDWVDARMAAARNYWICTTRADGRPHTAPVWGAWVDGTLYFGTDSQSVKARNLTRDKRVAMHLDSGDECIIFEGEVLPAALDGEMMRRVSKVYIDKYKLDPQLDETSSLLFRVKPQKVFAWRERDFPESATCWRFD